MSTESKVRELAPWFHNLHLPDGTETAPHHPLGDFPRFKWERIAPHLPDDLTGWTALDVGCNAGFYSFELARRGADVTGVDLDPRYLRQAEWASRQYGLEDRVQFERMQVYDLAHDDRDWDLVLFLGVLYHLRYPLLGLDCVASRARRLLVYQGLTLPGEERVEDATDRAIHEREHLHERGWPKMAFIEDKFAGDASNWWVPNGAGVEALLRSSGLRVLADLGDETWLCEPDPVNPSCIRTWNRTEFLSATGRPWTGADGGGDDAETTKFRPAEASIESAGTSRHRK